MSCRVVPIGDHSGCSWGQGRPLRRLDKSLRRKMTEVEVRVAMGIRRRYRWRGIRRETGQTSDADWGGEERWARTVL